MTPSKARPLATECLVLEVKYKKGNIAASCLAYEADCTVYTLFGLGSLEDGLSKQSQFRGVLLVIIGRFVTSELRSWNARVERVGTFTRVRTCVY